MLKLSLPLKLKGSFALLGASLTIALFGVLVHFMKPMFGTVTQTALRSLLAAIIMCGVVLVIFKRQPAKLHGRDLAKTAVLGVGGSLTLVLFTIAATQDKIASATFLLFTGSILAALLGGIIFLGERLTTTKVVAMVLAIGGLLVYAHGVAYVGLATVVGLGAGLSDGMANVVRKRMKHIDRSTALIYQYVIGGAAAALYIVLSGEQPILHVQLLPIFILVIFAVLALNLGNFLLYGYAHVDVQTGAVLAAMQVFFAILLGMLFLGQFPTSNELIGCAMICLASLVAVVDMRKIITLLTRFRARPPEPYDGVN